MEIISAFANAALEFRARPVSATFPAGAGKRLSAIATIGGNASVSYAAADVGYAVKVTADDIGDEATIAFADGSRTQDTGSPVFEPAAAVDFSGVALPAMDKCYAVRVTAGDNSGTVVVAIALNSAEITLFSGESFLVMLDTDGIAVQESGITFTFDSQDDSVTVEIIARATPA
jgi:hypothetical protein